MDTQNLIKMANQIAAFFHSMPDRVEAQHGLASHIQKFWDPRMRSALLQAIDQNSVENLHPLAKTAIEEHRGLLMVGS